MQQQLPQPVKRSTYWQNFYQYTWIIAALWAVEAVDTLFYNSKLQTLGIHPGNWNHWEGIILAPLLHVDIGHILGNSVGLAIFGAIILNRGWQTLATVSFYAIIVGGVVIMAFGDNGGGVHIGASGVVYGYWAYIVALGIYERTGKAILVAVVVGFMFRGLIGGMIPSEYNSINHISWIGHLGGALGGFGAAKYGRRTR